MRPNARNGSQTASPGSRLRRNLRVLLTGGALGTAFGVATLALNARALDVALLGVLALVQSYVAILGRLFSFDTWQGIIKFGAEAEVRTDRDQLRTVVTLAAALDIQSSIIAGLVGLAILITIGEGLGFPAEYLGATAFYVASLFISITGAPTGLMRLEDKFHWLTTINVCESATRFLAALLLFFREAELPAYIYSYGVILIVFNMIRLAVAFWLFRVSTGSFALATWRDVLRAGRSFMRFSAGSWVTGTINVLRVHGAVLVVGVFLGPAGSGLYAVAYRLMTPVNYLAEPLRQAIFPELSRFAAQGDRSEAIRLMKAVLKRTLPISLALLVFFTIFGADVLRLVAGPNFVNAYWILIALVTANAAYLSMPALSSLTILFAGMRAYTLATIKAAAAWAVTLPLTLQMWGVNGAGIGEIVFTLCWIAFSGQALWLSRRSRPSSV